MTAGNPRTTWLHRAARWLGVATGAIALAAGVIVTVARAEAGTDENSFVTRYAAVDAPAEAAPAPLNTPLSAPPLPPPSVGTKPSPLVNRGDAQSYYRALIEKEAGQQGLAPAIAEAVMAVESGFNPDAIGGSGEIGLMQIMPSTARMLGFAGSNAELAVPETNIHYGVIYLAQAWRLSGGDICTATMKYRAGHGETRFSYLSVNYCVAVRGKLATRGFPVTGSVPVATFGAAGGSVGGGGGAGAAGGCRRKCLSGGAIGRVDLAALNTKLSTLVMQVRSGR
jgi:soluble lytic murein transglycosylase-like protein